MAACQVLSESEELPRVHWCSAMVGGWTMLDHVGPLVKLVTLVTSNGSWYGWLVVGSGWWMVGGSMVGSMVVGWLDGDYLIAAVRVG